MIGIVNYEAGNLGSLTSALSLLRKPYSIVSTYFQSTEFDSILIPGVGAFDYGMKKLEENHLTEAIQEFSQTGKKIVGICLGMHLLSDFGEENGSNKGLGLIPGTVKKLVPKSNTRSPHMGWSKNNFREKIEGVEDAAYGYFSHNYYYEALESSDILAEYQWENDMLPSIIKRNGIIGIQFHPEKSDRWGLEVLDWALDTNPKVNI